MNEVEILFEAQKYNERRKQGREYSDMMNARLVLISKELQQGGVPDNIIKEVRTRIINITHATRLEITEGLWKSALDRANEMVSDRELQAIIDSYQLPIDQNNLIIEIQQRCEKAVNELY